MDKQKQIEEMAKDLKEEKLYALINKTSYMRSAENLYDLGYRKIPENAVVLTREELDKKLEPFRLEIITLSQELVETSQKLMKAHKETAEKIRHEAHSRSVFHETPYGDELQLIYIDEIDEICKEITEGKV